MKCLQKRCSSFFQFKSYHTINVYENPQTQIKTASRGKIIPSPFYLMRTSDGGSNSKIFLGLCTVLSGSTNVPKRLDVIVYPGNIRRVTGHALAECATSIRFQLITVLFGRGAWAGLPPPTAPTRPIPFLSLAQGRVDSWSFDFK